MRIKELRIENGLTQKQLGEEIQSTSKNIWAYENDLATPPLDALIRLADYFKCSIDYLVERADDFGNVNLRMPEEGGLAAKELHLVQAYRRLPNNLQRRLLDYLQALNEVAEKEKDIAKASESGAKKG